jgi:triacylglycerol lipase
MKILSIFLLFICLELKAQDLSSVYLDKVKEAKFSAQEKKKLQKLKVLIVPGVLAESFDSTSSNQLKMKFVFEDGFSEHKRVLTENNISFEYVNLETENSKEINAPSIIAAIESSPRKVLIYAHSKGGLDTLEALRQRPDLINKVEGIVTVQSPFWGTAIASILHDNNFIKRRVTTILEWLGGDLGSLQALTIKECEEYMERKDVKKLLKTLPAQTHFLNYSSYKTDTFGVDTPLEIFRDILDKEAGTNDGVVDLKSSTMAYRGYKVNYVIEKEVDHLMTMSKYRPDKTGFGERVKYSQETHLIALLKMIL